MSATGQSGDGRISPRSASLEAGPRRTCRPPARSESAGGARGPAQGATEATDQGISGLVDSHIAAETAPVDRQISTLVPLAESGTRGVGLCSDLLRRASSDASPRGLPISGADHDTRPALHVSPDPSAPGPFNVAVAGIVVTADRQPQVGVGCPQVRPALPLVTPHPFVDEGPQTLSSAKAVAVASPSPTPSNRSMRPTRAYRDVPVRSAFSAIECTGRREAKRLMTSTTVVDAAVSSRSERVSTGVRLPPRLACTVPMMKWRA